MTIKVQLKREVDGMMQQVNPITSEECVILSDGKKLNEVIDFATTAEDFVDETIVIEENLVDRIESIENRIVSEFEEQNSQITTGLSNIKTIEQNISNKVDTEVAKVNAQLSQKANKNEVFSMANMGQDVREAMTGGSVAVVGKNSVVEDNIVDGQVTPIKTSFMAFGENLFNKETITLNSYVDFGNGDIKQHSTYVVSDFIRVYAGEQYSYKDIKNEHFAFYTQNKEFISSSENKLPNPFTVPVNAVYVRLTIDDLERTESSILVNATTIPNEYKPYEEKILIKHIPQIDYSLLPNDIKEINLDNLTFSESINLFDRNNKDVLLGKYLLDGGGLIYDNDAYFITHYLSVKVGDKFTMSSNRFVHFFDENKEYISNLSNSTSFTVPESCKYVRITTFMSDIDKFMLNKGDYLKPYSPYERLIPLNCIQRVVPAKEEVIGYLPKFIYVAKGRTIELYNSQVLVCTNINDYVFQWTCDVGNAMKRKFRIDGSKVSIGDYELQLKVYDKYEDAIFEATATIKVVENTVPRKKILCIGDSLTNNKAWYSELDSLANGNLTFVGTRGNAPYNHEGRSGFTANGYLNATDYTFENEGIHKFWDGNRFNYSWYKTQNNINPDVVQIFLGTNGISLDPTNNANAIKQIIDYIRQDDPNIPIFVVNTLFRANQDGIGLQVNSDGFTASNKGKYKLEEDKKVINLAIRLYELLKDYDNLYFIPVATCHDSEFNFGSVETPVNPRASQTELLPVEATHPQKQGYLQFADIMYSTYCANLK